jgi:hypothetical protein
MRRTSARPGWGCVFSQMSDVDTFKLVSRLLSQEVSHIAALGAGNSSELTQNVVLLRDSRAVEVGLVHPSVASPVRLRWGGAAPVCRRWAHAPVRDACPARACV